MYTSHNKLRYNNIENADINQTAVTQYHILLPSNPGFGQSSVPNVQLSCTHCNHIQETVPNIAAYFNE